MARLPILALLGILLAVLATLAGCERLRAERKVAEEARVAVAAIQQYSAASEAANAAHAAVISAFDKANHSTNLPDYKTALRNQVLPAMDAFLAKLRTMPVGTTELKAIHNQLVEAYDQARREIDDFEHGLISPDGLGRFADIRDLLKQRVKGYRDALTRYYARYRRELRVDPAPPATALPGQATPATSLPGAATP